MDVKQPSIKYVKEEGISSGVSGDKPTISVIKEEIPIEKTSTRRSTSGFNLEEHIDRQTVDTTLTSVHDGTEMQLPKYYTKSSLVSEDKAIKSSQSFDDPPLSGSIKTEACHNVRSAYLTSSDQPSTTIVKQEMPKAETCDQTSSCTAAFNLAGGQGTEMEVSRQGEIPFPGDRVKLSLITEESNNASLPSFVPDNPSSTDEIKTEACQQYPASSCENPVKEEHCSVAVCVTKEHSNRATEIEEMVVHVPPAHSSQNPSSSSAMDKDKRSIETNVMKYHADGVTQMTQDVGHLPHVWSINHQNQVISAVKEEQISMEPDVVRLQPDGMDETTQEAASSVSSTSQDQSYSSTIENEDIFTSIASSIVTEQSHKLAQPEQENVPPVHSTTPYQISERISFVKTEPCSNDANVVIEFLSGKSTVIKHEMAQTVQDIVSSVLLVSSQEHSRLSYSSKEDLSAENIRKEERSDSMAQISGEMANVPSAQIPGRSSVTPKEQVSMETNFIIEPPSTEIDEPKQESPSPVFEPVVCSNISDLHGWEDLLTDNEGTNGTEDGTHINDRMLEVDFVRDKLPSENSTTIDSTLGSSTTVKHISMTIVERTTMDKPDQADKLVTEASDPRSKSGIAQMTISKENKGPKLLDSSNSLGIPENQENATVTNVELCDQSETLIDDSGVDVLQCSSGTESSGNNSDNQERIKSTSNMEPVNDRGTPNMDQSGKANGSALTVSSCSKDGGDATSKQARSKGKKSKVSRTENIDPKDMTGSNKKRKSKKTMLECQDLTSTINTKKGILKGKRKRVKFRVPTSKNTHKPFTSLDTCETNVLHNPQRDTDTIRRNMESCKDGTDRFKSNDTRRGKKRSLKMKHPSRKRNKASSGSIGPVSQSDDTHEIREEDEETTSLTDHEEGNQESGKNGDYNNNNVSSAPMEGDVGQANDGDRLAEDGGDPGEATDKLNSVRKSVRINLVDLTRCARDPSILVNYKLDKTVWVCPTCGKIFSTFANCSRHEFRHTGKRPYKCRFCDKAFNQNVIKQNHERLHTNERPFVCHCGRAFNKKCQLTSHRRVHERKFFECELCDKKFYQDYALDTHIRVHHNNEKRVKCPECDHRVKYRCQLKSHMQSIHSEEKPFLCDQCDFKTKTAGSLRTHMRIHSDIKPYKCGECGMCFRTLCILKNHYRTHTGEKPFKCQYCDRGFSQAGNRHLHEKICPLQD